MKRRLIALLGVSLLAISLLAACDGGRAPADDPAPEIQDDADEVDDADDADDDVPDVDVDADEITLIVWESVGGPDEFIRQAGEAFTALHPHITIDFQNVELGDATTSIALDGPAGIGADVFAAPHDRLGELVTGGHINPVNDVSAVTNYALSSTIDAVTFDGVLYGFPVAAETYALFFNRALIADEDVPTSFEEIIAMQDTWVPLDGSDARLFMMDVANAYYTILFSTSDGNRLFGPDGDDQLSPNMNTPAAISGFEFFQSLRQYIDIAAEDLGTADADAAFVGAATAMHISGPWNVGPFNEEGIDFGITTLPSLPGDTSPAASFSGTRTMFVSAYTLHPEEAEAFAAFLVSPEMQQLRYEITGALPSINITIDDEQLQGFVYQLEYAFPMPSLPAMGVFWEALNAASANIWNGGDVEAELDALQEALLAAAD